MLAALSHAAVLRKIGIQQVTYQQRQQCTGGGRENCDEEVLVDSSSVKIFVTWLAFIS